MLLSVCLIARDEERFLAGCLDSVAPVADEIVLVDTGSTDSTREIARRYGCRVVERPWDDDFAAARNAGIDLARGAWIFCIDADERLDGAPPLRPALAAAPPEVGGFLIERHDHVVHPEDGQSDVYPIEILRAFRNHPGIRYEGIVHERPNDAVRRAGFEIRSLPSLRLDHLVCALPHDRLEAKQRRYLALLDREIETDPENHWARYYRGKTVWFLRRPGEAEEELRTMIASPGCPARLAASARCMLAALASERGGPGEALEQVAASLELVPNQSLAFYVLAEALYAAGHYSEARAAFLRVRLSQDPEPGEVPGDLRVTRDKRAYKLGCCALALGDLAEAERQFRAGLAARPEHSGCHYGMARVVLRAGEASGRSGRSLAVAALERAIRHDPGWKAPRELLAELKGEAGAPDRRPATPSS